MPQIAGLSHLLNPLATSIQLEQSASQLDGVPKDLEDSVRFETARLIQAAGILLRLPQEIIAQAIVILQRYYTGTEGGSLLEHDSKDIAAAALYLTAKPSATPVGPKSLLTTFAYLDSLPPGSFSSQNKSVQISSSAAFYLPASALETARATLYNLESHILTILGFQTHTALPHPLLITYLQTLSLIPSSSGTLVAKRALAHLNTALLSPQMLYITHQPHALATAAIYLAAREVEVKLPECEWWEVFDVEREELGFLVVAMRSVEGFVQGERQRWSERRVPVTVEHSRAEIEVSGR